jgi:hypothetical protein
VKRLIVFGFSKCWSREKIVTTHFFTGIENMNGAAGLCAGAVEKHVNAFHSPVNGADLVGS